MELGDGVTLRELLAAGPLPTKKLLAIGAQVADGLAKAHGAGIVRRDLKLENVMVTNDGFAKILDFGLAKLTQPEGESGEGTQAREPRAALRRRAGRGRAFRRENILVVAGRRRKAISPRDDTARRLALPKLSGRDSADPSCAVKSSVEFPSHAASSRVWDTALPWSIAWISLPAARSPGRSSRRATRPASRPAPPSRLRR